MKRLRTEARQNEVDKYSLHVEEVDKITSLLLGLSSRLARSEISLINLKKNWNEDEEVREEGKLLAQCRLPSEQISRAMWPHIVFHSVSPNNSWLSGKYKK